MAAKVLCVTQDCADPVSLGRFWAEALGYDIDLRWQRWGEVLLTDPERVGPDILLMAVPEPKTVKNRMHLDLIPDTTMEAEVERLEGAGAHALRTLSDPDDYEDPWTWTVLQDPEGNEFCVGQMLSDRAG
ncbi:MAG TPA: VOC family protein [Actinomycetota bacterium]|nr:VOC family protein [Actinomycetota bacterium]